MGLVAKSYDEEGLPNIWGTAHIFNHIHIQYEEAVIVIYDYVTAPFWISLYKRKFFFIFLSVHKLKINIINLP
jgi:hypothetical protein